ncbi:MAG: hypothetical protein JNK15_23135 [Planctomycetes bacterium]|nr:hypothetical protein [Planctomycetota bacterium]
MRPLLEIAMLQSSSFAFLFLIAAVLPAQEPAPPAPNAVPQAPVVEVPTFPNPTCPIMGKKVSMPLFVDTELGRFYVCCKPCYKKIRADVPAAHKTAFPVVTDANNKSCPVSGEAIGDLAVAVTLQGSRFKVCCEGCVAAAREHSQVTLTKVTRTGITDIGNRTCPVSGKPTAANAFVLVDNAIVHLAEPALADAVAKDPTALLAKAKAIAAAQPPTQKHEHTKPTPKVETPKEGK